MISNHITDKDDTAMVERGFEILGNPLSIINYRNFYLFGFLKIKETCDLLWFFKIYMKSLETTEVAAHIWFLDNFTPFSGDEIGDIEFSEYVNNENFLKDKYNLHTYLIRYADRNALLPAIVAARVLESTVIDEELFNIGKAYRYFRY